MASSPPSSPAASRDTSPAPMLTPRSKIKALLATVDSSDDEGSPTTKKTKKAAPAALDSDSDVSVKPRGKLASRMQGAASISPQAPKNTPGDARERVKQMIQREAAEKETEKDITETPAEQNDDDDDEDDAPVTTRRLHRRPERETTPDTTEHDGVSNSPGLFVSPAPPTPSHDLAPEHGSDSEADLPSYKSDRFKALVERKRKEREAREAEEEARRAERFEKLAAEATRAQSDDDGGGISDDEGGRNLSQSMPKRKASKKAIEEIERETQRIQRNMQLRHEALTRKKVTKSSLFDRFNYRPAGEPEPAPEKAAPPQQQQPESSHPTTPPSEVEMKEPDAQTPPSSPPSASKFAAAAVAAQADGPVQQAEPEVAAAGTVTTPKAKPRVRVQLPLSKIGKVNLDEDDELEVIVTVQDKVNAVFENVPKKKANGANSLQVFRAFAMANSPERVDRRRKGPVSKMSTSELQTSLQQRARAQAKVERDRRMTTLKAQGIVIQTAEERERQEAEVEDLVAKAREEAQRLMKEEREEVKKDRLENGERDALDWDDSEEEYEDSANEADGEGSEIELSGSEDEEADKEEEVEGENKDIEAVAETEATEATKDEDEEMADEPVAPTVKRRKARNVTAILSDDDEEGGVTVEATPRPIKIAAQMSPMTGNNGSPAAPTSVIRSAKKTFIPGLPVHGAAGMGLTQIFAGTMDSQMSPSASRPTQSMMPDFDHFPASNLPPTMDDDEEMEDIIKSSQAEAAEETQGSTQGVRLDMSQSQMRGLDSLIRDDPFTQPSQDIEPSQDMGLQTYTPIRERFVNPPQSTVDTVIPSGQTQETGADSPLVQRKGRLRRKAEPEAVAEDEVRVTQDINMDTFAAMKEKAKKEEKRRLAEDFNHKKSKAKEMVQEQAEESEDEYAGVGGVDGEDSDNESNASVQEMIDDDAGNNEDEEKLAAFYANREIVDDEKAVEKLYKDITTGALRRKRGADYDLSDSDDGGEAHRRLKRRQFAKMQKALFADERVQKMATDPGNEAFLRTMHDRGSDDEVDLLGDIQEGEASRQDDSDSPAPSQGADKAQVIPDSQPRKVLSSAPENRAPAYMRRTKDGRKPSNIGEVRETLSDLLEDPHGSVVSATDAGSDSEEDAPSNKENASPNRRRSGVVDRISLKRTNSNMSTSSNSSRLAFSATGSATGSTSGFKVPMLLRRATTNSSMLSGSTTSSTAAEAGTGGFGEEAKIKKTASKKSGVVRGAERVNDGRAKLEENERKREQRKARGAEKRVGMVGGLLGKGSFA